MKSYLYKIFFNGRFLPKKLVEVLDEFDARLSYIEEKGTIGMAIFIKFTDLNGNPIKGVKVNFTKPEAPPAHTGDNGIVRWGGPQRGVELNFDYSCAGYKSGKWQGFATENKITIKLKEDKSNTVNNSSNKKKAKK